LPAVAAGGRGGSAGAICPAVAEQQSAIAAGSTGRATPAGASGTAVAE
jgi:hypothetical protein